jgi:hypothetical protein
MRILNRPMFRYGGPIREGLMHGMKNGGRAALVGNPVYPKTDGREHHFAVSGTAAALTGLRAIAPWIARQGSRYLMPLFRRQVGTKMGPGSVKVPGQVGTKGRFLPENVKTIQKQGPSIPKYEPTWLGKDPIVRGVGWAGSKVPVKGAWNFATSPSSLVIGGVTWYMWPDGTQRKTPPPGNMRGAGPLHGAKDILPPTPEIKKKTAAELAAEAKAARNAKLEKYLDTMGYDKAKKTAMGDALIDASAIVQDATTEAGSLKKADWSKLINRAIQSTSKRLDKPEQIREAVGLMMTKADIEKDMEDPQAKELKRLQILGAEKALAGKTTSEIIQERMLKGDYPSGKNLARLVSINNPGANIKVIPSTGMKPDDDTIDYITQVVTAATEAGKPFPPGNYVIKDQIIQVDETGTVTPIPISALK